MCAARTNTGRLRASLAQLSLSVDRALPAALRPQPSAAAGDEAPATQMRQTQGEQHGLEAFLYHLQRQGYLEKVRVASATTSADAPGAPSFEWRWGARAEIEIGERAVAEFIGEIYSDGAKPEGGATVSADLAKRIERAAGTPLVG